MVICQVYFWYVMGIYHVYTFLNSHMMGIYQEYNTTISCIYYMYVSQATLMVLFHRLSWSASPHTRRQPWGQPVLMPGPNRSWRQSRSTGFDGCVHGWTGQGKWLWLYRPDFNSVLRTVLFPSNWSILTEASWSAFIKHRIPVKPIYGMFYCEIAFISSESYVCDISVIY